MDNEQKAIYDVRELGKGKAAILGLQHMFAMFGATVLVPILTGLSVSATLLFAGLATLFMHLVTGKKVPVTGTEQVFHGHFPLRRTKVKLSILGVLDADTVKQHRTHELSEMSRNMILKKIGH